MLVAADEDERARRMQRLGVVEATFDPLPIVRWTPKRGGELRVTLPERPAVADQRELEAVLG